MESKPYIASLIVQLVYAVSDIMSKIALVSGMDNFIFIFYRYIGGTILLVLVTLIFFKRNENVSLSLSLINLSKIFGIALVGTIVSESYNLGIDYTSATFAAAASNCVPVTTFFFAVLFRMEKVNIRTAGGIAKVTGIVLCTAGVAILTFYKGHYFKSPYTHQFFHNPQTQLHHRHATSTKTWILGCLFLVISAFSSGLWFVLQARFLEHFPYPLVFVCLQSAMTTIQCLIVAVVVDRDHSQWQLGWNIRLLSIIYCAISIAAIANTLQCWVIKQKGPVFHAMTTPLQLVATIIGSAIFLSEGIYLGSILAAVLLVISLYSVLWGKTKDPIDTQNTQ